MFQTAANYSIRNRVLAKVSKDYGAVKYLKIVDEELVKKTQNVEIILLLKMYDKYTEVDKGQSARTGNSLWSISLEGNFVTRPLFTFW